MMLLRAISALACAALTACVSTSHTRAEPGLLGRLAQGGYVLLMPHAGAPSTQADAPELETDRCAGQNHLSEQEQIRARRQAEKLRKHAVSVGRVLTSHDCRCIATAAIVFGQAEPWSIIDETRNNALSSDKNIALREAISRWTSRANLALVSHQSNINAALGLTARPAEILIIEPLGDSGFRLLGTLPPN